MSNMDKLKDQVSNLREHYKLMMTLLFICLGGAGTMVYMAIDKKNNLFYILFCIAFVLSAFVGLAARKAWIDLENKTEELENA